MTYGDLGDGEQCNPAVDLDHQCVHLAHKHFLPLWALLHRNAVFTFWEDVILGESIDKFVSSCGLVEPDGVLVGPQEDGVLSMRTGGAAQSAGHDPPVRKGASC